MKIKTTLIRTGFCLLVVISLLITAHLTEDDIKSRLFVALGTVAAVFTSYNLSKLNQIKNE